MRDKEELDAFREEFEKIAAGAAQNGWLQCQLQAYRKLRDLGMIPAAQVVLDMARED